VTMEKRVVVVLGMHRSGTSAITRGLQVLDVNLGEQLSPAVANDNDKGYFEDIDVKNFNVELLNAIHGEWDRFPAIPASVLPEEELEPYKARAIQLICSKVGERPFGLKDPRIAILLPFWQSVFEQAGVSVSYVIAVRNPMSVMQSLKRRNGFEPEKSYFLWLGHMLPAVLRTHGCRRVAVSYDSMISEPLVQLSRIARALDLPFDAESPAVQSYTGEFLDATLRHAECDLHDLRGDSAAPADVITAYEMLLRLSRDEADAGVLEVEDVFEQLNHHAKECGQAFAYIACCEEKIAERDRQIAERDRQIAERMWQIAERDAAINAIYASRSWRVTRPLRFLTKCLHKDK